MHFSNVVYNSVKYKYGAIYTQLKIFKHWTLRNVQMNLRGG